MKRRYALRLTIVAGLAAACTLLAVAVGPQAGAATPMRPCPSPTVKVLAQGREAALYQRVYRGRDGFSDTGLYMCRRDTGARYALAGRVSSGVYWFPPPAMAVAGPYAAFAENFVDPDTDEKGTGVGVVDTRARRNVERLVVNGTSGRPFVKVGSLVLRRTGAIAWVECPALSRRPFGDPRPNCVRAGLSVNRVYRRDSNTAPGFGTVDLLDEGRGIDPASLRLRGATVSWMRDGRRRTATLAGANFNICTPTPTIPIEPPCPPGSMTEPPGPPRSLNAISSTSAAKADTPALSRWASPLVRRRRFRSPAERT